MAYPRKHALSTTTTGPIIIKPGSAISFDAKSKTYTVDLEKTADGLDFYLTMPVADGENYRFELQLGSAPNPVGTPKDIDFTAGSAPHVFDAAAFFHDQRKLIYSLVDAPAGVAIDSTSGLVTIAPATTVGEHSVGIRASNGLGSLVRRFLLTVRRAGAGLVATTFATEDDIADLSFVFPTGTVNFKYFSTGGGFGRLTTPRNQRVHGDWKKASGDGLYRTLVRFGGANLEPTPIRRASFGARVRVEGANFHGVRLDVYDEGGPRLQLRDYTGAEGNSVALGTRAVEWRYGSWHWLEFEVVGDAVRGRIYAENAEAPDWQVSGRTRAAPPGAYGPGGFPGLDASPVIDIRRIEFMPAK